MTATLYVTGASLVHRAPAGLKLAALAGLGAGLFVLSRPEQLVAAAGLVLVMGLGAARLPVSVLWAQVRPVWLWLGALLVMHLFVTDLVTGLTAVLRVLTLVLAAGMVTATTRVTALVAAVERIARPLQVLGVRPARIGLVIAMTLRFIPVVAERATRIREAQAARGAVGIRLGFAVPLLVQVLTLTHTLAEALDARGADDVPPGRPRRRAAISRSDA